MDRTENLVSISTDGNVLQWSLKKGLVVSLLMQLKRGGAVRNSSTISQLLLYIRERGGLVDRLRDCAWTLPPMILGPTSQAQRRATFTNVRCPITSNTLRHILPMMVPCIASSSLHGGLISFSRAVRIGQCIYIICTTATRCSLFTQAVKISQ